MIRFVTVGCVRPSKHRGAQTGILTGIKGTRLLHNGTGTNRNGVAALQGGQQVGDLAVLAVNSSKIDGHVRTSDVAEFDIVDGLEIAISVAWLQGRTLRRSVMAS